MRDAKVGIAEASDAAGSPASRTAQAIPARKAQLPELTSMRFFAAMAVLLGHFADMLALPAGITRWFAGGYGVSFFFVLSGFILTYRYWDDFAPGVERGRFRRYFVARIARVYPSYAMALVLMTLLYVAMDLHHAGVVTFPPNPASSWLANLFALQTFAPSYATQQFWNAPSWSISTEFGFYLTCPLILATIARRARGLQGLLAALAITVAFAVAMQALALDVVFRHGWDREFWLDIVASRNIFWRMPEFLTGVVAARLLYGGHLGGLAGAGLRNTVLVAGLVLVAILNAAPWPADTTSLLVMRQFRLDIAYMVPFGAIVVALAAGPTFLSPILARRSWVFLGDISYAIYIYHWVPWTVLSYAIASRRTVPPGLVAGIVVLTILFSAASYLWYEKPVRYWIRAKFAR